MSGRNIRQLAAEIDDLAFSWTIVSWFLSGKLRRIARELVEHARDYDRLEKLYNAVVSSSVRDLEARHEAKRSGKIVGEIDPHNVRQMWAKERTL
jgi:hypothetical protein